MAHHNSTPRTVLDAPSVTVQFVHEHPQTVVKGTILRTGPWVPYVAPDRVKRRGKKAARHAARKAAVTIGGAS